MKLNNKKHWDSFIYGLIYPGFVGSMIYELIPQENGITLATYFTLQTIVKIIITMFYCIDYLHLYGDMHEVVPENKRSGAYLLCDFISLLLFFLSFVFVKIEHYYWSLVLLTIIPILFFTYKRKNKSDKKFFTFYISLNLLVTVLLGLNVLFNLDFRFFSNAILTLLIFSLLSFIIYCFYVVFYYEKYSRKIDIEIYKNT